MIFFFELFENNEERYEKPDLKSDKTVVYMFKHKTNESLKVGYNATVLKKFGRIKMINAQLKSGISGTYMHVCHTSMTHKLHACAKHL